MSVYSVNHEGTCQSTHRPDRILKLLQEGGSIVFGGRDPHHPPIAHCV